MSRPLVLAAALFVLAAPAPVLAAPAAQMPFFCYHKTSLLKNVSPAAVLVALHWNAPDSVLPQGVRRIYALQSSHCLLVEATPDGYERVKALVAPLDVSAPTPQNKAKTPQK